MGETAPHKGQTQRTNYLSPHPRIHMKNKTLRTVIAATILGTASSAIAGTEYLETFENTDTVGLPFSSIGWNAYMRANDNEDPVSSQVNDVSSSDYFGSAEVYHTDYAYTRPEGRVDYRGDANGLNGNDGPSLLFASAATTGLDSTDIADLSLLSVDLNPDASIGDPAIAHFAIQIGSQWYASNDDYTSTTELGPGGALDTFALSGIDFTNGNNWRAMTVSTGTGGEITIAAGAVGGTLSGDVTNYGLYAKNGNSGDHFRFDNFEVNVVPEPGTFALLSGALALATAMIRRRRA